MTLAAIHVIGDIGDGRRRTMVNFAVGAHFGSVLQCLFLLSYAGSFFFGSAFGSAVFGTLGGGGHFGIVCVLVVGPREGEIMLDSVRRIAVRTSETDGKAIVGAAHVFSLDIELA